MAASEIQVGPLAVTLARVCISCFNSVRFEFVSISFYDSNPKLDLHTRSRRLIPMLDYMDRLGIDQWVLLY